MISIKLFSFSSPCDNCAPQRDRGLPPRVTRFLLDTSLLHDWLYTSYLYAWMGSYLWLIVSFLKWLWPSVPRDSYDWCWPWWLYHRVTLLRCLLYPPAWNLPATISMVFPTLLFSCVDRRFIFHVGIWFLVWWWYILPACFLPLAWLCSLFLWVASLFILSLLDCGFSVDSFSVGTWDSFSVVLWILLLGCESFSCWLSTIIYPLLGHDGWVLIGSLYLGHESFVDGRDLFSKVVTLISSSC